MAEYWKVVTPPRISTSGQYLAYLQGYPSEAYVPFMVAPIATRIFVLTAADCGVTAAATTVTAAQAEAGILTVVNADGSTDPLNGAVSA